MHANVNAKKFCSCTFYDFNNIFLFFFLLQLKVLTTFYTLKLEIQLESACKFVKFLHKTECWILTSFSSQKSFTFYIVKNTVIYHTKNTVIYHSTGTRDFKFSRHVITCCTLFYSQNRKLKTLPFSAGRVPLSNI